MIAMGVTAMPSVTAMGTRIATESAIAIVTVAMIVETTAVADDIVTNTVGETTPLASATGTLPLRSAIVTVGTARALRGVMIAIETGGGATIRPTSRNEVASEITIKSG
jgi:hypothetical protein